MSFSFEKVFSFFLVVVVYLLFSFKNVQAYDETTTSINNSSIKGEIIDVNFSFTPCRVTVKLLQGNHQGISIILENDLETSSDNPINLKVGDKVIVYLNYDEKGNPINGHISQYIREVPLLALSFAFLLLILIIGGFKGFKAIITLIITAVAILKYFLPSLLDGKNPFSYSIYTCILITFATLLILNGFHKKTFVAIMGTCGGVLVAGIISKIVISVAHLSGFSEDESFILSSLPISSPLDFRGLLFAGIILGALGAVMDVSMSIASALNELKILNPDLSLKDLRKSGFNVGKDIMGTMSNTLILAYVGGSMNVLLLYMVYNTNFMEVINNQIIFSEILRSLAGSIGLILTIPITIFTYLFLEKISQKNMKSSTYKKNLRV